MDKFILLCSEEEKEKIRKLLISKFHRKYRVAKREIINEQNSREVTCEICNKTVTKWNYAKHQKTWKCLQIRKKNESKSEVATVSSNYPSLRQRQLSGSKIWLLHLPWFH